MPLFSIASNLTTEIATDLDNHKIDQDLFNAFLSGKGYSQDDLLPPVVEQQGSQWAIIDSNDTSYQIRNEQQALNVYGGENAGNPVGENMGVPYAWGLSSGLIATAYDKALDSQMIDVSIPVAQNVGATNASFDAKIAGGYFAGNIWHVNDNVNNYAAGVDCVGLINNVWRMGGRYGLPRLPEFAPLIPFKNIQMGDILMKDDHVMMFDHFDPSDSNKIWVYESSATDWKVGYHSHTVAIPVSK